jgi:hypothetical protein
MYEQFNHCIGHTDLQLTPDPESSALLQERLAELKGLLDDFEATGGIHATEAPAGPASLRSFFFNLGKRGARPSLQIDFRDYPGGYHASTASGEERRFVSQLLNSSHAVVIVIDAPALMEDSGRWHDMINRPQQMADLFKQVYQELDSPRLVIFAPVKCEKYVRTEEGAKVMLRRVTQGYDQLIELFNSEPLRTQIAAVVTPVQTVGTVVFSHIEVKEKVPHFHFRKISHDAKYSPQDSEQPLRFILRFLLRLHVDGRSEKWKFFKFIREWLGLDAHLYQAVQEFARHCKDTRGFSFLQGAALLKANRD